MSPRETPAAEPTERIAVLESAIRWVLGEEGEFGEEPEPVAGKYRQRFWWRSELRRRAGLSAAPSAGPDLRERIEQLPVRYEKVYRHFGGGFAQNERTLAFIERGTPRRSDERWSGNRLRRHRKTAALLSA